MKSFLVCLLLVLASGVIGSIDTANQPYEEVKPFTFQVVEVPVSSGYVESEYNLKPVYINCSVNVPDADRDLFGSFKFYKDYQKLCISTHKRAIESFESLCSLGPRSERPPSSLKSFESYPEELSNLFHRFAFIRNDRRRLVLQSVLEEELPVSWSEDQKNSFHRLFMDIDGQFTAALRLSRKLENLSPQLPEMFRPKNYWASLILAP